MRMAWSLLLLVFVLDARTAAAQSWSSVAPGVEIAQWVEGGPRRVSAARIDLCKPGVRLHATTIEARGQVTSRWGSSNGMAVAINAGFFFSGYRPHGIAGGGGREWSDSAVDASVGWAAFGRKRVEFHDNGGARGWEGWMDGAASASHMLLFGGNNIAPAGDAFTDTGHPRTAVGVGNRGRTMFFVVVDGRSGSSVGAPLSVLAGILQRIGATDAINLDGGGSSDFWSAATGVWNVPSDGRERVVSNHFGVTASGSGEAYHCPDGWQFELTGLIGSAGRTVTGEVGTIVQGGVKLKNTGTKPWGAKTKVAPLPRDQASPYAAADWTAPARMAAIPRAVAENETIEIPFSWKLPAEAGKYKVPITMLEEGVTWFGDSFGPKDGTVEITLDVKPPPPLRARIVSLEPANETKLTLAPGETAVARVALANTGSETWREGDLWIAPTGPRGRTSSFQHRVWKSDLLAAQLREKASGEASHVVEIWLEAPSEPGVYAETFGLVTSDGRWFADSGGPGDHEIHFDIEVVAGAPTDAGTDETFEPFEPRAGCFCGGADASLGWLVLGAIVGRRRGGRRVVEAGK